jgi:hypothetical protein
MAYHRVYVLRGFAQLFKKQRRTYESSEFVLISNYRFKKVFEVTLLDGYLLSLSLSLYSSKW